MLINGADVAPTEMLGPWTTWSRRVLYKVHNVTTLLRPGARNCFGAWLGNGQYNGVWTHAWARHTPPLALLAHLRLHYANGSIVRFGTTANTSSVWRATAGPITTNSVYAGETYDARLAQPGWALPGFANASAWSAVAPFSPSDVLGATPELSLHRFAPIRIVGTRSPVRITQPRAGTYVAHFATNFVGITSVNVSGPPGARVTLAHAEQLQLPNGTVCLVDCREYGDAAVAQALAYYPFGGAEDSYTLRGNGTSPESWHPVFTYHGYQFVQVDGWPQNTSAPTLETFTGLVVHSDVAPIGAVAFPDSAGGQLLAQINDARRRSLLSNFHSVEEDCPTRERVG